MKLSELNTYEDVSNFAKEVVEDVYKIDKDVYNEGAIKSMEDISNNLRKSLNAPMSEDEKETWLNALKDD